jgi:hypothetical protein
LAAITAVFTITYVAEMLGEDEDWLWELSIDMFLEDGCLRVYGVGEDGVTAFTAYGIECLKQIIADQKGRRKGAAPDPVHGIAPLRGSPHADPQDRPNLVVSPDAHCDSSPTRDERPHEVPRQVDRSRRIRRSRASPGRSPR